MTEPSPGAALPVPCADAAPGDRPAEQERVVRLARAAGLTVAVAESLTAGLVSARLADVPGASAVLRGAVVAYATDLKSSMLDVPTELLAERGPVDPDVAVAMATGARTRLSADLGVATTGVAGPDPQDDVPPGLAFVAATWPGGNRVRRVQVRGERAEVRAAAARAALELLADLLTELQ
ncbi:MAG: CinA family protein [Actinomycetes bacterium]